MKTILPLALLALAPPPALDAAPLKADVLCPGVGRWTATNVSLVETEARLEVVIDPPPDTATTTMTLAWALSVVAADGALVREVVNGPQEVPAGAHELAVDLAGLEGGLYRVHVPIVARSGSTEEAEELTLYLDVAAGGITELTSQQWHDRAPALVDGIAAAEAQ